MTEKDSELGSEGGPKEPQRAVKKKWWKYFFEFLMLFLAVTLGFFVDNFREEIADRSLESQHIQSILSELKQDTAMFRVQVQNLKEVVAMCDSVILLVAKSTRTAHDQQRLYFLTRRMSPRIAPHFMNDRAFEEMRSSGSLRLIRHKNIADSITKYYFASKELLWLNNLVLDRSQRKIEMEAKIFSAVIFDGMVNKQNLAFSPPIGNPPLTTNDPAILNEFAMTIHFISSVCIYKKNYLARSISNAERLLLTLRQEYPELR